jgi:hypothetical protein
MGVGSGRQGDILWSPRANHRPGGCKASSRVLHQAVKNECLCTVEEPSNVQMKEKGPQLKSQRSRSTDHCRNSCSLPSEKKDDDGTPGPVDILSGNCPGWAVIRRERQEQLQNNDHGDWAMGKEGEANQTSQTQPSEKKKWLYACRPFRTNSHKEGAVWHLDPLLGNNCKISKSTAAITESRLRKQAWQQLETGTVEQCFLCDLYRDVINRTVGVMNYLWDSHQPVRTWVWN